MTDECQTAKGFRRHVQHHVPFAALDEIAALTAARVVRVRRPLESSHNKRSGYSDPIPVCVPSPCLDGTSFFNPIPPPHRNYSARSSFVGVFVAVCCLWPNLPQPTQSFIFFFWYRRYHAVGSLSATGHPTLRHHLETVFGRCLFHSQPPSPSQQQQQ